MLGSYAVDASRFPKVQVRFVGALTDEAFRAYLNEYGALLARGERYGIVFDATQADRPTAVQRRMQSEWIHANEPVLRRLCVGGAFAISSSLVRGAMQAILWVSPLPFEHVVVERVADADAWLDARLKRAAH